MTYNCVDAVDVYLDFGHERIDVGRLVIQNRHIWFSYHHSFFNFILFHCQTSGDDSFVYSSL